MKICVHTTTVFALGLAAISGCSDAAAPEDSGTYVLRSISGNGVPAVFQDNDFATLYILADTLILSGDGTGRETWLLESLDKGDGSIYSYADTTDLTYTLTNGHIEIAYECDDLAVCAPPPHLAGVVTPTGLEFDVSLGWVPLVFESTGGQ